MTLNSYTFPTISEFWFTAQHVPGSAMRVPDCDYCFAAMASEAGKAATANVGQWGWSPCRAEEEATIITTWNVMVPFWGCTGPHFDVIKGLKRD